MEDGSGKGLIDSKSPEQDTHPSSEVELQNTDDMGQLPPVSPDTEMTENQDLPHKKTGTLSSLLGKQLMNESGNEGDALLEITPIKGEPGSDAGRVNMLNDAEMDDADDSGTEDECAAFMKELERFHKENGLEFKPPKFYGEPLNLLKLWRAVVRLGGYDHVTGTKLWRQVGESFHPPKTCTTVSWTFRIFYEKALLEYEKHKRQIGELRFSDVALPEPTSVDNESSGYKTPGPGRQRRDAAARAMQGWHSHRLYGFGEEKHSSSAPKREKPLKSISLNKQKKPANIEQSEKAIVRTDGDRQVAASVVDLGPPADWVKINVRETKDCFEVYALVPGLLREEVRVQSDPAGRLVITGQPEQLDNPWGITSFKKVVNLPARIDPLQTSAVVSLHGRLFVRVPFEQPNFGR